MWIKTKTRDGRVERFLVCECHAALVQEKVWSYLNGYANRTHEGYMHRIIWQAKSVGNENIKTRVVHKNGNLRDNRCENLVSIGELGPLRLIKSGVDSWRIVWLDGLCRRRVVIRMRRDRGAMEQLLGILREWQSEEQNFGYDGVRQRAWEVVNA